MVPELSWLFAVNLFLWLFALMIFALNGHIWAKALDGYLMLPSFFTSKIDMVFFETTWSNFIGLAIFILFLVMEVYYDLASSILNLLGVITGNNEWGPWWTLAFYIIIIVLLFVLLPVVSKTFASINAWADKKKEEKEKEEASQNRKELAAVVGGISQGSS